MSTTTLRFTSTIAGVATDATSVVLQDPTTAFGVRRTDTLETVVAAGTVMTHDSTGHYSYTFTDPAAGVTYNYWVEVVYSGNTYQFESNRPADAGPAATSYLDVADADVIAATVPALIGWSAGTSDAKARALRQASSDVDAAMPYQGRRYDPDQALEFPRLADPAAGNAMSFPTAAGALPEVWDWDSSANAAIVPQDVSLAVLYQADSILLDSRESRIAAQHDGVVYELTGTIAESYKQSPGNGVRSGLCRRSWMLIRKYRRQGGALL